MPNFLVWNVQRKPLEDLIARLVDQHRIDVLILIEPSPTGALLPDLLGGLGLRRVASQERFGVFVRTSLEMDRQPVVPDNSRVDYWWVLPPSRRDGLLVAVHGQDRQHYSDETRAFLFRQVADQIRFLERQMNHKRTVIVGDFNVSPFEPAVAAVHGLHALGVRSVRGRTDRLVARTAVDFFYNPMWRQYGRGHEAGSATHFFPGYNAHELMWHMIDQVILRPEALDLFPEERLQILTSAGGIELLDADRRPDQSRGSDHLPLLFSWDL